MPARKPALPLKRIAVVGLGQIGGSIVLSLRKKQAPYHITGIDISAKRLRMMKPHLDAGARDWKSANDAGIVILCLHFEQIVKFFDQAPRDLLITDVCSGKLKLLQIANERKIRFVGGHPMAGNEFEGEKGWREDLFADAPYFLTAGKHASKEDVRIVKNLARDLGGRAYIVNAQLHDEFVAVTSQFPAFLSQWIQTAGEKTPKQFRGPGFRSMTRLAKTSPALLNTFLQSNAANIIDVAEQFRRQLHQWISTAKMQRTKNRV